MKLETLEALAKAATPGPWREFTFSEIIASTYDQPPPGHMVLAGDLETIVGQCIANRDVDFIAAANPTVIIELIALVRQMRDELKDWHDDIGQPSFALAAFDRWEGGE
jgi:hypothetical protein